MALRVLLADESSTIKKVFQLSLQDYAVEITTVSLGGDVAGVAQTFEPDIIFADVLLQKKNGYEVSKELKAHAQLKRIPIVLMWSNFMEIDEDKFDACGADEKLEKPFDVKALRQLVQKLAPKTKTQKLSQFLTFPNVSQHFIEEKRAKSSPPPPLPEVSSADAWTMDSFENIEAFAASPSAPKAPPKMSVPPPPPSAKKVDATLQPPSQASELEWGPALPLENETDDSPVVANSSEDGDWVRKDIGEFKVDLGPQVDLESEDVNIDFSEPDPVPQGDEYVLKQPLPKPPSDTASQIHRQAVRKAAATEGLAPAPPVLTPEQLETIIREQSAEVIEAVVWKVVPELASQLIERELKKLLKDTEKEA